MNIFEITIQRKLGATWPIVVEGRRSGVLPVRVTGQLFLDETRLLAAVEPQAYGQLLGEGLFREGVRDAFTRALGAADDGLHVLLFVEDDGAKSWRWERLCAPMDGDWSFLALDQRTPFSLYLPSAVDRLFPPIGRRDLQALIIAASPSGLSQYGLAHFDVTGAVDCVRAAMDGIPHEALAPVDQVRMQWVRPPWANWRDASPPRPSPCFISSAMVSSSTAAERPCSFWRERTAGWSR